MNPLCLDTLVQKIEVKYLKKALAACGGNKKYASGLLNMKRTTFVEKLKRYNLFERKPELKQGGFCIRGHEINEQNGSFETAKRRNGTTYQRFRCKLCGKFLRQRYKELKLRKLKYIQDQNSAFKEEIMRLRQALHSKD